jgi:6-pyruvoyltetrahydropterin/6-carboxytetrahydropterin synthase
MEQVVRIVRKVFFSSAVRYHNPLLSESENQKIYGSLWSHHGHGHNYGLEAHVEGKVRPDSGMVMSLRALDEILKSIAIQFDHKHINLDVPAFSNTVPTTEKIALYIFDLAKKQIQKSEPDLKLHKIRLIESEDVWIDVVNSSGGNDLAPDI